MKDFNLVVYKFYFMHSLLIIKDISFIITYDKIWHTSIMLSSVSAQHHMHGKKQAASIVSTLMRKVYLTPKYWRADLERRSNPPHSPSHNTQVPLASQELVSVEVSESGESSKKSFKRFFWPKKRKKLTEVQQQSQQEKTSRWVFNH